MNTHSQSLLLLSGAGLPSWIWDQTRDHLGEEMPSVVAPRPTSESARLRDYAEAAIAAMPTEQVVLVGHSAGGVVASEIAHLAPERVAGFLAVSAIVPRAGGSFVSAMPAPNRWVLSAAMRFAGTKPPESAIRKNLASGLDGEIVDRLIDDFTPEPQAYFRDHLSQGTWSAPRGYVMSTTDMELPPALQKRFAANLGGEWTQELTTGHLPMLEDPAGLATAITAFVDELPRKTTGPE